MGTKRGTREFPLEWRKILRGHVESWIASHGKHGKPERQIAPLLGIKQSTLNEILNLKGSIGLHVLLALRESMHLSLDDLLGLPPLAASLPPVQSLTEEQVLDVVRRELDTRGVSLTPAHQKKAK